MLTGRNIETMTALTLIELPVRGQGPRSTSRSRR